MHDPSLLFASVSEAVPGDKWLSRWRRSWPAYRQWFNRGGGQSGPRRQECESQLLRHMPELFPVYRRLVALTGDGDTAARFLSTWNPPVYLGGCTIAAKAGDGVVRLVRNYDLSPDLNEGVLLRSEWSGMPVMGMVEFLWGLSDGVNGAGLTAALAYGGSSTVGNGFGVTTIVRYVLETCETVREAVAVLKRVPSHMAYNITLADKHGATCTVELAAGGGAEITGAAIATNHQRFSSAPERTALTQTFARKSHLEMLYENDIAPMDLGDAFLEAPIYQTNYENGFGTLFTAEYDPIELQLVLRWPNQSWINDIHDFHEDERMVFFAQDGGDKVEYVTGSADSLPWYDDARLSENIAAIISRYAAL